MLKCEIYKQDSKFSFNFIDEQERVILEGSKFHNKKDVFSEISKFISSGYKNYVYEICDEEDCYYFKITSNGLVLLESVMFDRRGDVFDFAESLKGGCMISHVIDKSFDDGQVIYYLTCTQNLKFKSPILIEFEKEEEEYVGSIRAFDLYAYSDSVQEIIEELKTDIEELYETLFIEEHELTKKALAIKERINSNLVTSGL